ncbi:MAG: tail fiber protein [Geminicoccaceae bacterium]
MRLAVVLALAVLGLSSAPQTARAQAIEPYYAQIVAFPYTFCPKGWLEADGTLLPIAQYTALFSLLGTTYGGNGVSTFGLPDLRGRAAVGEGQGPGLSPVVQGEQRGFNSATVGVAFGGSGTTNLGQRRVGSLIGATVPTRPPSLGLRFCIATQGIYPSRP